MDFYNILTEWLMKNGFHSGNDQNSIWYRVENNQGEILYLVPESLPGQDKINIKSLYRQKDKICSDFMIKTGLSAECLMLAIFRDMPDKEALEEMELCPDIWCISRLRSCLFIYERQRTEFYGLRAPLESFLSEYGKEQHAKKQAEFFRNFTPVNTALVLINIFVFVVLTFLGDVEDPVFMAQHGALFYDSIVEGKEYYRIITSMFLHFGADHLFQNMLILLIMGWRLEKIIGKIRYFAVYMGSGIIGSAASIIFTLHGNPYIVSAGASGAIFGVLGGVLGLILVDVIKKKRQRIKDIGLTGIIFAICAALSYGFFDMGVDNAAHVGGLLGGLILTVIGG